MTNEGFIILPRPFFQSHLWNERRSFSKAEAWIDLCQRAAFEPHPEYVDGKLFDVGYGQVVASNRFLQNAWCWKSLSKVQKFLKDMSEVGEIEVEKRHGQSLITCCELACYYERKVNERSVRSHLEVSERSMKGQIKEYKKEKKVKKERTTTTEVEVAVGENIITWFSQMRTDQLFIEQCQRQHGVTPARYQKLLNDFYKQKLALGELTHRRYTELRKNFLFWIPKNQTSVPAPNNGQGIQYKNSINLKLPP